MCGRQRQTFFLIDLFPQKRNTTPLLHSELRRIRPFQVAAAVVVLVTRLAQNAVRHILPCQELRSAWRQRIQFVGDMKLASLTTSCESNGKCQPCKGLDHLFLVFNHFTENRFANSTSPQKPTFAIAEKLSWHTLYHICA